MSSSIPSWAADRTARQAAEQAAGWPDGVIARYLNVGGATVDLTETPTVSELPGTTRATCTGCGKSSHHRWVTMQWNESIGDDDEVPATDGTTYTAAARTWAQDHASTCRAMVDPGGAT